MSTQAQLSPLEQLGQDLASQQSTAPASAPSLSPLEQLGQDIQKQQSPSAQSASGTITNDVGNTVIVPKEGESFDDTMRRAAAYGRTVTQDQINRELASAPKKIAQTLVAAPLVGAGGTAALAGAGAAGSQLPGTAERLLQISETALEHLAENYPQLTKLAAKLGYGAGDEQHHTLSSQSDQWQVGNCGNVLLRN